MQVGLREKVAADERRQKVARWFLEGWSQAAVARKLGVNRSTVTRDLQQIRREWRAEAVRDFDEARGVELARLSEVERNAWEAWDRSQEPLRSALVIDKGTRKSTRTSSVERCGGPRYLAVVLECMAQRRELLGLDGRSPTQTDPVAECDLAESRRVVLEWAHAVCEQERLASANRAPTGGDVPVPGVETGASSPDSQSGRA